jgi:hypothetical protein
MKFVKVALSLAVVAAAVGSCLYYLDQQQQLKGQWKTRKKTLRLKVFGA